MKKPTLSLTLLVAVLAISGTGCSHETSSSSTSTSSAGGSSSPVASSSTALKAATVTWWNNYQVPDLTTMTEADARKSSTYREYYYAKDLIDAFQTANPAVTVTQVYKGAYADIAKAVNAGMGTGNIPSMASVYGDNVAVFNEGGITLDVSARAQADLESDSDFNQNYLSAEKGMYGGKYLSMPYSKSTETLVVNKTVLDKVGAGKAGTDTVDSKNKAVYTAPVAGDTKAAYTVPTNWTDMIKTARKMKTDFPDLFANQRDADGYFKAVPFCWDSGENMFISLMENMGISYTAQGNAITDRVLFNNADAKKLVVQLKKWNNEGLIATQNQLPLTDATKGYHQYSSNMVVAGQIFMAMSSTAGARYFATNGGFQAQMNQGLAMDSSIYDMSTPTKTSVEKVISQGPSLTFFKNADKAVEDATWAFYKYLTNADNSAKLAVNTAYFPLRTSSYNSASVKALTDAATAGVTADDTSAKKGSAYAGQAMKLNETYGTGNKYFLSPVFDESSACRTAVGGILTTVFNDKTATTDDAITSLVNDAFTTAYTTVTK
jgi:multiple sugar transport system substrate-binding protein